MLLSLVLINPELQAVVGGDAQMDYTYRPADR